jgi:hypothetical protein
MRKIVVGKIIEPAHTFAKNLKPSLNKVVDSILMSPKRFRRTAARNYV